MSQDITHAGLIPLIGGEMFGAMQALGGKQPEYVLSYEAFGRNESHLKNYLGDVPWKMADEGLKKAKKVDVMHAVCPCAGLSTAASVRVDATNDWMFNSTELALTRVKPEVLWGENAPALSSQAGKWVADRLAKIGYKHGYSLLLYRTQSVNHGLPQKRRRSFYFFFKGSAVPEFNFYKKPLPRADEYIDGIKSRKNDPMDINLQQRKPSEEPFVQYALEKMLGGISYKKFLKNCDAREHYRSDYETYYFNKHITHEFFTHTPEKIGKYCKKRGYDREGDWMLRKHDKIMNGGAIMFRYVNIPRDVTGAFVLEEPWRMAHPFKDRFLTVREMLGYMGLPKDFDLVPYKGGIKSSINHICQNVPVSTAKDMMTEVIGYLNGERSISSSTYMLQDNCTIHSNKQFEYRDR